MATIMSQAAGRLSIASDAGQGSGLARGSVSSSIGELTSGLSAKTVRARAKSASKAAGADAVRDIFTEFGEEHNEKATLTFDSRNGGVQRSMNIRRHWKSDTDIRRWHKALTDHSRFDRLLTNVRERFNEDFGSDRAELVQKHNALFRQRRDSEERSEPAIWELKKLQLQLKPKQKKLKKKKTEFSFLDSVFKDKMVNIRVQNTDAPDLSSNTQAEAAEGPPVSPSRQTSSSTDDRAKSPSEVNDDTSASALHGRADTPVATPDSDVKQSVLDLPSTDSANVDDGPALSSGTPPSGRGPEGEQLDLEQAPMDARLSWTGTPLRLKQQRLPQVQLPRTLALFLFRNADRHHAGQPVFLPRMPGTLTELLQHCTQACRPLAGPAEALFDTEMRLVRSLLEVRSGGSYLLKGAEGLDAPPAFFAHPTPKAQGFRHMVKSQQGSAAEVEAGLSEKRRAFRLPCVGSPPPHDSGSTTWRSDTWEADPQLCWQLSHGGLGSATRHHHNYGTWPRALSNSLSSHRSVDQLNVNSIGP